MTPKQYNELIRQAEVLEKDKENIQYNKFIKNMKEHQIKLYREVENLIIKWSNDGTKTAGSLTREIMSLLETETWEEVEEEYLKDEYPAFGGPFTNAMKPFEWLRTWYNPPVRKPSEGGSYSDLEKLGRGRSKH